MRTLDLKGRTTQAVRDRIAALAWATERRGQRYWAGNNVPAMIHHYLVDHGASPDHYDTRYISYVIKMLEQEGYGKRKIVNNVTIRFEFDQDVEIRGFSPAFPISFKQSKGWTTSEQAPIHPEEALALQVPLPKPPPEGRYKHELVNQALDEWAEVEPDVYADWADSLLMTVKLILDAAT